MTNYWLDLFTPETWEEARKHNFKISGFREHRWRIVQKIKPGDLLICYVVKVSRFAGILKVTSKPHMDRKQAEKIWKNDSFPCIMNVEPIIALDLLHSVPVSYIVPKLTIAAKWSGIVRGSPNRIIEKDGNLIRSILDKSKNKDSKYLLPKSIERYIDTKSKVLRKQEYGQVINFRALRRAPINEQGVVFLFALVAKDLGFSIEAIGTTFPDCEAMRCLKNKKGREQRVNIEFEYLSSNYDHRTEGCDIIVCWKHDWPECPLEVIELSEIIKQLGGNANY